MKSLHGRRSKTRVALTAAWLAFLTLHLLAWELTLRWEGLLLWTLLGTVAFGLTVLIVPDAGGLPGREGIAGEPPADRSGSGDRAAGRAAWGPVAGWGGIVLLVLVAHALVPEITVLDTPVRTVAFVGVADLVLPIWILVRAILHLWRGPAGWAIAGAVPVYAAVLLLALTTRMPGQSHQGPLDPPTEEERLSAERLDRHVRTLAGEIGPRGVGHPEGLEAAVGYITRELTDAGYAVEPLTFEAGGRTYANLQATLSGTSLAHERVVVGAHYDSFGGSPGADDNASGVAGVLELARLMASDRPRRTVHFVLFANEEPPFFNTEHMGSRVYARSLRDQPGTVVAMLSLETIGYFDDAAGSQRYPFPLDLLYPGTGDFLGFVGNPRSAALVRRAVGTFRDVARLPSEGAVLPAFVPGVDWSDHSAFWRHGIPAVMITDTAPFRNVHYHTATDDPTRLDLGRTARAVVGIREVVRAVAGTTAPPA